MAETSYEPVDLSDFTLHFKDHSFHVHTVILCKESQYFISAVKATHRRVCSLSSLCGQPGHRCLTLPDTLGGYEFTAADIDLFLRHMYDGSLFFSAYFAGYTPPIAIQPNVGFSFSPSSSYYQVPESKLNSFLATHAQVVKLSHYFDCPSMLRCEEQCCGGLASEAEKNSHYESLWRLLVLSQSCHWKLTSDLITAVSKDKQFKTRPSWATVSKSLTIDTFTKLLESMASN